MVVDVDMVRRTEARLVMVLRVVTQMVVRVVAGVAMVVVAVEVAVRRHRMNRWVDEVAARVVLVVLVLVTVAAGSAGLRHW